MRHAPSSRDALLKLGDGSGCEFIIYKKALKNYKLVFSKDSTTAEHLDLELDFCDPPGKLSGRDGDATKGAPQNPVVFLIFTSFSLSDLSLPPSLV